MSDAVLKLLQDNNLAFTVSGKDYLIKCLNPQHEDTNPSCRVDRLRGLTHCLSCGFKANLFKYYGVFTNNTSIKIQELKDKLEALKVDNTGVPLPKGATPYTHNFRGISAETLKHFGAFYTHDVEKLQDRIIFPITDISDKTLVYVARHTLSDAQPRYVNYPQGVTMPVFPAKVHGSHKSLVLVEGIFDMLNMYDRGVHNVSCTFGTSTLKNNIGRKLLAFKVQGITKIFILFDGDTAGREAAKELKPLLEAENFLVEIINLPDDMDPGDMDQEYVDGIKEYIK